MNKKKPQKMTTIVILKMKGAEMSKISIIVEILSLVMVGYSLKKALDNPGDEIFIALTGFWVGIFFSASVLCVWAAFIS